MESDIPSTKCALRERCVHFEAGRRHEALQAISRSCGAQIELAPGWEVLAICDGPEVVGGVMRLGSEIHIGTVRPVFLRALIRQFVRPGDTTRCRETHASGRRFVERLGFELVRVEGGIAHYTLREAKHA